jgi:hypothetical protein
MYAITCPERANQDVRRMAEWRFMVEDPSPAVVAMFPPGSTVSATAWPEASAFLWRAGFRPRHGFGEAIWVRHP